MTENLTGNNKLRIYLYLVMVSCALVVGVISLSTSYREAFQEHESRLTEIVQSRARMIEAVAKFHSKYSSDFPGGSLAATLSQIREAHHNFQGIGETGEFVLARLEEDQIKFLLRHRQKKIRSQKQTPTDVPFDSKLAEPMRMALLGKSGVIQGLDYRGIEVLAAFEPVAILNLGIVAKIDLEEIRAPYIHDAIISASGGFLVILIGGFFFIRTSERFMLDLKQANLKLRSEVVERKTQEGLLKSSREQYKLLFSQVKCIIEDVSRESGKKFFALLAQSLAVSLGFKYCLVGELDLRNDGKVKTLAAWNGSRFMENLTYDLGGTPCENIIGNKLCTYSGAIWKMFPEDEMLCDLRIESYVGVPLNDSSNNPLGVLCVMHDESVGDLTHAKLILPLFADIVGLEMERQVYEKELQRGSEMARVSGDIAVAANEFSDAESTLEYILQRLCRFMGWPVGHIYLKSDLSTYLVPSRLWHIEDPVKYQVLKAITEQTIFENGMGLPGRVMATGRPEWVRDVRTDTNFPRAENNRNLEVRTALACPVTLRKEVVGVMEFFTPQILDVDWEVLDMIERLGTHVGRVLERKESDEVLRKQAEVLDQIHDAVISLDLSMNIIGWNRGAERIFHYSESEILNKSVSSLFLISEEILKQIVIFPTQIKGSHEMEIIAKRKGGEEIFVHLSLTSLCDEKCIPQSLVCYALDISEKKQAQLELEEYSLKLEEMVDQRTGELDQSLSEIQKAKNQIEGILKSMGEGILVTDYYGKLMLMNPAAELIFGVKKEDVLNKDIEQVVSNKAFLECWNFKLNEKYPCQSFGFELLQKGSKAGSKFFRGSSTLLLGEGNYAMGVVVVIRDITFEKKVDDLKSQFLSTAAHELRTPLTSLQGFSEILLNKKNLGKETEKKYLQYINEESLKLATIINSFLDISRIESGKGISLDKALCSVGETINRSMHIFDEEVNGLHKFNFIHPAEPMDWEIDQDKVEQVFRNIYSNAIKYSPNGGMITTTVKQDKEFIGIIIQDEGLGMSEEQLSRIYDRFYRGENVENDFPGSGLGMTIVKYILEAHGGNVKVESEMGQGTRVTMRIPNN
jgi:PAS domain S-box-containing protein